MVALSSAILSDSDRNDMNGHLNCETTILATLLRHIENVLIAITTQYSTVNQQHGVDQNIFPRMRRIVYAM